MSLLCVWVFFIKTQLIKHAQEKRCSYSLGKHISKINNLTESTDCKSIIEFVFNTQPHFTQRSQQNVDNPMPSESMQTSTTLPALQHYYSAKQLKGHCESHCCVICGKILDCTTMEVETVEQTMIFGYQDNTLQCTSSLVTVLI